MTDAPRILVAYFSRAGENYHDGGRRILEVGNTEVLAQQIAAACGADMHRIEASDPYDVDYDATVRRNVREEQEDARPAIAGALPNVADYDVLLLGSPVWNVQSPMIMRTFLEQADLGEARVHAFVTYAMSELGSVERDYRTIRPDVRFGEALAVRGEDVADAESTVHAWLDRIGLR